MPIPSRLRAVFRPQATLVLIPALIVLWIWLSPLAFMPVPWPDDSAFYFVGREFWKWPPRWVMLPQAPFEPTYRIFNFNTMPLYPLLVGFGRLIGIDGSFAIKLWPLSFFALTAALLARWTYRAGLPALAAGALGAIYALDPAMRWASVLVRPESLIGLCGMALVLGLSLGWPERFKPRGLLWDPVAALLAVAAYAHFNAIHLLFPVVLTYALRGRLRELVRVGLITLLYLTPWLVTVAMHPGLFWYQMRVQWTRLAVHNDWLDSVPNAVAGLFKDLGNPEPWPAQLQWASVALWVLILLALGIGVGKPLLQWVRRRRRPELSPSTELLVPASGWVLGSVWLWESKPEVWFIYYVHASVMAFAALSALALHRARASFRAPGLAAAASLGALMSFIAVIYGFVDVSQAVRLGRTQTWHWSAYHAFVDCIDQELTRAQARLGDPKPFRVWGPTFPDVTVELSRRHPDWDLTRTNDFWERSDRAVQHGRDVEAVVVTEALNWPEREISAPQSERPFIESVWMTWEAYFLNRLWKEPGWKPNRFLCQRGRWQAFIFEK